MPFQIIRQDITKMKVDAIVNPANPLPGFGESIDSAVYAAAGNQLLEKRLELGVIEAGNSFLTPGYELTAKYIIHTVGTYWQGGEEGEEEILRACYRSTFFIAKENKVESLATPLLASGSYGFPKGIALRIALSEIETFLSSCDIQIYLVVFDEQSYRLSSELYGDIDSYINERYVEEKNLEEYPSGKRRRRERNVNQCSDEYHEMVPEFSSCSYRSLDEVIGNLEKTFMEMVFTYADQKNITDAEIWRRANLDKRAFSKLKCGKTKNPSKTTALALAIALELSLDDTKDLLSRAGLALSRCSKQDLIVQYFIEHKVFDVLEINTVLFDHNEAPLGYQLID